MNERERLLAEGPRIAPEPPTADGFAVPPQETPKSSRPAPQDGGRKVPSGLVRLFPIGVFAVVLAANAGAGKYALWVIVPLAVGLTLFRLARKGNK